MITITFFTSLRASEFVENTKIQLFENGHSITELVPVKELISNAMYHQKGHRSIMLSLDHEIQSDLKMIIHLDGESVEIDDIPSISNHLQSISN